MGATAHSPGGRVDGGVDAAADLAVCIVTTSPNFAGRMARGIDAVDSLRVSSILDGAMDLAAALRGDVPDAIVLDQLTCSSLLEKIVRTISRMARKPHVVVVTPRTDVSERAVLLSSGVDFVFTKLRPIADLGLVLKRLGRPESKPGSEESARAPRSGLPRAGGSTAPGGVT